LWLTPERILLVGNITLINGMAYKYSWGILLPAWRMVQLSVAESPEEKERKVLRRKFSRKVDFIIFLS